MNESRQAHIAHGHRIGGVGGIQQRQHRSLADHRMTHAQRHGAAVRAQSAVKRHDGGAQHGPHATQRDQRHRLVRIVSPDGHLGVRKILRAARSEPHVDGLAAAHAA